MRRTLQNPKWLSFVVLGLASACASGEGALSVSDEVAAATPSLDPTGRAYPYSDNGVLVCGARETPGVNGAPAYATEWYPTDTMNRHLQNAGGPDAVGHVTVEFRDALAAEGIQRIESCADAREYVRLNRELTLSPAAQPPSAADAAAPVASDFRDPLVDKILNGTDFDNPPTVAVLITPTAPRPSLCTGQLLGPFAMVTAGHCMPSAGSGFIEIQSWIQTSGHAPTCIAQSGGVCRQSSSGNANVYYQVNPNYDGTPGFDQAVIIGNPAWSAPANSSARWTAIAWDGAAASNAFLTGATFRLAGYGASANDSTTAGYGRRTPVSVRVGHLLTHHFTISPPSSTGVCEGDSGSGVHSTVGPNSTPISIGIFSQFSNNPSGSICQVPGNPDSYSEPDGQWIMNLVNFFGGSCRKVSGPQFSYLQCF